MTDEPSVRQPRRTIALEIAVAVFLAAAAWVLVAERNELATSLHQLSWAAVVGSLIAALLGVLATFYAWLELVRDGGTRFSARDGFRIFGVGQLGKYVPGAIWPVLTQAHLARRRGTSPSRVAAGSLIALAVSVCVAILVGGVLLPFSSAEAGRRLWWVPLVALPALAIFYPAVLNRIVAVVTRRRRGSAEVISYSIRGLLKCAAWSVVGDALFGVHIFLLVHSLHSVGARGFALSVCAYAFASAIGVVIVFLPAGAGAREAMLTLLLAPVLDVHAALVVALVSRAIMVVVDLIIGVSQTIGIRRWTGPMDDQSTVRSRSDDETGHS